MFIAVCYLAIAAGMGWLAAWTLTRPAPPQIAVLPGLVAFAFLVAAAFSVRLSLLPRSLEIREAGVEITLPGRHALVKWEHIDSVYTIGGSRTGMPGLMMTFKEGAAPVVSGPLKWLFKDGARVPTEAFAPCPGHLRNLLRELRESVASRKQLSTPGWAESRLKEIAASR